MEENATQFESLLERVVEYSKTSLELFKLKTIEKSSDVISSLIPQSVVFVLIVSILLFVNIGLALWLGEILGKVYYGFFVVAGFYFLLAIVLHFLMRKWIKKNIGNYIIKQFLN